MMRKDLADDLVSEKGYPVWCPWCLGATNSVGCVAGDPTYRGSFTVRYACARCGRHFDLDRDRSSFDGATHDRVAVREVT